MLAIMLGTAPALAAVEQCRFIQAKPDREACYDRQAMALAAKRKPEATGASDDLKKHGIAGADEARRRGTEPAVAQYLPGLLSGLRTPAACVPHSFTKLRWRRSSVENVSRISFMTSRSFRPERASTWKE